MANFSNIAHRDEITLREYLLFTGNYEQYGIVDDLENQPLNEETLLQTIGGGDPFQLNHDISLPNNNNNNNNSGFIEQEKNNNDGDSQSILPVIFSAN